MQKLLGKIGEKFVVCLSFVLFLKNSILPIFFKDTNKEIGVHSTFVVSIRSYLSPVLLFTLNTTGTKFGTDHKVFAVKLSNGKTVENDRRNDHN